MTASAPDEAPAGVWLAYYYDSSDSVTPFADEVSALRYALSNSMQVLHVPYGVSLNDADNAKRRRHD